MKKTILVASVVLLLVSVPAVAQMMGSGSGMMGGDQDARPNQQMQQTVPTGGQNYPQHMNRGMTGGYGYGMGSGMMGGYGTGLHMMGGGYGYGMGSQMMGGAGHSCMSGFGHDQKPNMMGYGMGPGMMGGYGYGTGSQMMSPEAEKQYKEYHKKTNRFLDETRELRKDLNSLKFEYHEALRSTPEPNEKLDKMRREMFDLHLKIYNKSLVIK
jgi:hypothetical protein